MRMEKQDKEITVILIMAVIGLIITILFARTTKQIEEEYTQPIVREIEHLTIIPYTPRVAEPTTKENLEVEPVVLETTTYYDPTDEELELMARVVMSEGSILPLEGKQAIAQTIINRMYSSKFPNNIEAVITQPHQYSIADNGEPNSECYEAVLAACKYIAFPTDMYYFRTGHYHEWAEDYTQIGVMYFSTERTEECSTKN